MIGSSRFTAYQAALLIPILTVASCSTLGINEKVLPPGGAEDRIYGTRVFVERTCPISRPYEGFGFAELATGILTSAVDRSLELVSAAVASLGETKTVTRSAATSAHFYDLLGDPATPLLSSTCIIVVEGWFGKGEPVFDQRWNADNNSVRIFGDAIGLVSLPTRYLEMQLSLSDDRSAFTVRPATLHVRLGGESVPGEYRDVAATLIFHRPSVDSEQSVDDAFAVASFALSNVASPTFLDSSALNGIRTSWLPVRVACSV